MEKEHTGCTDFPVKQIWLTFAPSSLFFHLGVIQRSHPNHRELEEQRETHASKVCDVWLWRGGDSSAVLKLQWGKGNLELPSQRFRTATQWWSKYWSLVLSLTDWQGVRDGESPIPCNCLGDLDWKKSQDIWRYKETCWQTNYRYVQLTWSWIKLELRVRGFRVETLIFNWNAIIGLLSVVTLFATMRLAHYA